jgi:hypothetical protein
MVAGMVS